ncbi:SRPBCC family protein [Elongatibacter sediminis]|uniref:SRPBCC family protein n=1 Tax=Elongatibacter sediminis TaxID=3119006 RepID=A0AAW9RFR2_9GAMM
MLKKVFYSIVIIVIALLVIGLFLPREVHVERSIVIERPAPTVFALVDGYATFNAWSPWAVQDPTASYQVSGPDRGVGARMEWEGDPRLTGRGEQEIVLSEPYRLVRTRLRFDQQGEADSYFALQAVDAGTRVTWGFDTDLTEGQSALSGLVARYFGLFFDRWIGTDYERGLSNLKAFAEELPDVDISGLDAEILDVEPVEILYIETGSRQDPGDVANALADAYQKIMGFILEHNLETSAQPMAITRAWDENGYAFDAAIPAGTNGLDPDGEVQAGWSPSGHAVRVIHRGPYDRMKPTYDRLAAYMAVHGLKEGSVSWEQYISDPGATPEDELVTHIYFLLEGEPGPDLQEKD